MTVEARNIAGQAVQRFAKKVRQRIGCVTAEIELNKAATAFQLHPNTIPLARHNGRHVHIKRVLHLNPSFDRGEACTIRATIPVTFVNGPARKRQADGVVIAGTTQGALCVLGGDQQRVTGKGEAFRFAPAQIMGDDEVFTEAFDGRRYANNSDRHEYNSLSEAPASEVIHNADVSPRVSWVNLFMVNRRASLKGARFCVHLVNHALQLCRAGAQAGRLLEVFRALIAPRFQINNIHHQPLCLDAIIAPGGRAVTWKGR